MTAEPEIIASTFSVALRDVVSVENQRGIGTSIIGVRTADARARFRCYGPRRLADRIRAAVGAA